MVLLAVATWWLVNNPSADEVIDAGTITYSTDSPDETMPGDGYVWPGQASDPRKLVIPSLGIDSFIQNVGVDQNNQIAVPNNIHIAGWFVDSVRPGQPGLSIIDGHIDGVVSRDGVFGRLPGIEVGAEFYVESGDGSQVSFRVIDVTEVVAEEAHGLLFSQKTDVHRQLNLITCIGSYDAGVRTYDNRMIVRAEAM